MSQAEELLETLSTEETTTDSNVFPTAEPGVYKHGSNFTELLYTWDDLCNGVTGTSDYIKGLYGGEIEEIEVEGDLVLPEILDETTGERLTYIEYCTCGDVVIPASVTTIDYLWCYAAYLKDETTPDCKMETIYVKATTPPTLSGLKVSEDMPDIKKVVVPTGCAAAYTSAEEWSELAGIAEIVEAEDASTGDDTSDGDTSDNETILDPNEPHIVIDSARNITVPESLKRIAVQHDHNVETVTFDCPRYWDGIDFSTGFVVYINYMLADGTLGSYIAENISVDADDSNIMHFTWTISSNVTPIMGKLTFLVCIKKVNEVETEAGTETVLVNHWNSELCRDMYVSEGLETTDVVSEMYPDFITQVLTTVDRLNQSDYGQVVQRIEALEAAVNPGEDDVNIAARLVTAESDISNLKPRMATAENSIGTLQDDVDDLKPRMTTAESDIDAVETRMATAEGDIDALQDVLGLGAEDGALPIERGGTGATNAEDAAANLNLAKTDGVYPSLAAGKVSWSFDGNTTKLSSTGFYFIRLIATSGNGWMHNAGIVYWNWNTVQVSAGHGTCLTINADGTFTITSQYVRSSGSSYVIDYNDYTNQYTVRAIKIS